MQACPDFHTGRNKVPLIHFKSKGVKGVVQLHLPGSSACRHSPCALKSAGWEIQAKPFMDLGGRLSPLEHAQEALAPYKQHEVNLKGLHGVTVQPLLRKNSLIKDWIMVWSWDMFLPIHQANWPWYAVWIINAIQSSLTSFIKTYMERAKIKITRNSA